MFIGRKEFERTEYWHGEEFKCLNEKIEQLARRVQELEDKTSVLDEYSETEEEDRKAERSFLQGLQNIMNFRG